MSGRGVATAAALLLAVFVGWRLRVYVAHANPAWNQASPVGLLKSDPALLYWFTERIAENGGSIPEDFARTTSVQWPDAVDARVEFPQLQPLLAANLWRWIGGRTPLHEFCLSLFSLLAATTAVAAWGLAWELTRRRGLALLALALFFLLPANWRTMTFVLLGEDVAFPCLAAHLWLLARAARVRTTASYLGSGLFLALAMAAWHASGFFVAIEAAALFAWYLRSGANPLAVPRAWLVVLPFVIACAFEPMLRGKLQLFSLPMQLALALLVMVAVEARGRLSPLVRTGAALGLVAAFLGLGLLAARWLGGGLTDYSHVFRLVAAKLSHLGVLPRNPNELPFEVRILWQGPFDSLRMRALSLHLSTTLAGLALLIALALPSWWRGRGEPRTALLALAGTAATILTWLILRTEILAGFLLPAATVLALRRVKERGWTVALALVALVPPAATFPEFVGFYRSSGEWYQPAQVEEFAATIAAIDEHVPPGKPVAADEILSTAILAHARRPILAQPKYEWKAARERLEEFRTAATRGTPEELAAFLRAHRCRHLAYDWLTLWVTRYQVGLADDVRSPDPKAAITFAANDPEHLPGFRLLWKSPLGRNGVRLYELIDE